MALNFNNALAGAAGGSNFNILQSLRLRSAASAYLTDTFASAGTSTWTWSGWIKRGKLTTRQLLFTATNSTNSGFGFDANDKFCIFASGAADIVSTPVFRDCSAWGNLVVNSNGTTVNAWWNGNLILTASLAMTWINGAYGHSIGRLHTGSLYFDGYIAEINFVDGQALSPTIFGRVAPAYNVWKPRKFAGNYGNNGFYLDFATKTSTTTLAYDKSGKGNNWTPGNISLTAGATYDSMRDVPFAVTPDIANYSTIVNSGYNKNGYVFDGGLRINSTSNVTAAGTGSNSIDVPKTGKWYVEVTVSYYSQPDGVGGGFGVGASGQGFSVYGAMNGGAQRWGYSTYTGGENTDTNLAFGAGTVMGFAMNCDANTVDVYYNGVLKRSGIPMIFKTDSTRNAGATTNIGGNAGGSIEGIWNFGQRDWAYGPPSAEYKKINSYNLPEPAIANSKKYMDATTYTGNGVDWGKTFTASFTPDFVWIKSRSSAYNNSTWDVVRNTSLITNSTAAENSPFIAVSGSTVTLSSATDVNANGTTYVGWQWKKGATPGFDIVTYTGDGTSPRNINHNLGAVPAFIMVKGRSVAYSWTVKHKETTGTTVLLLQDTSGSQSPVNGLMPVPTSSTYFTIQSGSSGIANLNASGATYVAYLWSEIDGFSKFGTYTGNGSADGTNVQLGFKPKFLMIKRTNTTGNWEIFDSTRNPTNVANLFLEANLTTAEQTGTTDYVIDFLANGFKLRGTGANINASGSTYVYAAFAETPQKYALAD